MKIPTVTHLTNSELVVRLEDLRGKENEVISDFVLHLSEMDRRKYFRDLGYSSLFAYVTEGLGYHESNAHRSICAARCLTLDPEIYFKLREGKVSLCSLSEVARAPIEERKALLTQIDGKSTRDVHEMVSLVRPIEAPRKESVTVRRVAVKTSLNQAHNSLPALEVEQRYTITIDADKEFVELLEKASLLVGTKRNLEVIRQTLKSFIERKTIKPKRISKKPPVKNSRYIPVQVKAAVYERDGHQCTYECNGRRCTERHHLEIEHCLPYALGGTNDESNLRLLCRTHNRLMAEEVYGARKIQQFAQSSP